MVLTTEIGRQSALVTIYLVIGCIWTLDEALICNNSKHSRRKLKYSVALSCDAFRFLPVRLKTKCANFSVFTLGSCCSSIDQRSFVVEGKRDKACSLINPGGTLGSFWNPDYQLI